MEIDIFSPQIRMRSISGSNKRARSPGSPSAVERASKRPMMLHRDHPISHLCQDGGQGKRKSLYDDEWVHQTRGMTIHSPGLVVEALSEDSRTDVQMSSPEGSPRHMFHRVSTVPPATTRLQDIEDSSMTSPVASQSESHSECRSLQAAPPPSLDLPTVNIALDAAHSALNYQPRSAPPSITLHPATPSTPSDGPRLSYVLSLSQPSTPPSTTGELSSSPMSIIGDTYPSSPTSSQCRNHGLKKRPFVSMGPRADCEKCRLKTPGHWMHFD